MRRVWSAGAGLAWRIEGRNPEPGECAVYRLWESWSGKTRYIGCTRQPLWKRLQQHLNHPSSWKNLHWMTPTGGRGIRMSVIIYVPVEQGPQYELLAIRAARQEHEKPWHLNNARFYPGKEDTY